MCDLDRVSSDPLMSMTVTRPSEAKTFLRKEAAARTHSKGVVNGHTPRPSLSSFPGLLNMEYPGPFFGRSCRTDLWHMKGSESRGTSFGVPKLCRRGKISRKTPGKTRALSIILAHCVPTWIFKVLEPCPHFLPKTFQSPHPPRTFLRSQGCQPEGLREAEQRLLAEPRTASGFGCLRRKGLEQPDGVCGGLGGGLGGDEEMWCRWRMYWCNIRMSLVALGRWHFFLC